MKSAVVSLSFVISGLATIILIQVYCPIAIYLVVIKIIWKPSSSDSLVQLGYGPVGKVVMEAGEDGQRRVNASPISGQEFALLSFNRAGSRPPLQPQVSYYSICFSLLPAFLPSTIRVPSSSWVGLCLTPYISHSTLHIVDIQLHCELN